MKAMMKTVALAVFTLAATLAQAGITVTNVTAQQRWPWNGLVDIDYTVVSDDPDADVYVYPQGFDGDFNVSVTMRTLTGAGAGNTVKPGTHRMTWDAKADKAAFHSSSFSVTMHAFTGAALYLVVDLSGGTGAASYPVRYAAAPPDLNDDTCRTTELWLRLILPGTFMMGSPAAELGRQSNEDLHQVTLTAPFYMGVFEVTQKQWQLVMGTTPSQDLGDTRPVEQVSYNMIRGTINGAQWPAHNQVDATSFFGVLRAKTSLVADLPTDAQWEYACRAGTATALNSGKDLTNIYTCPNMAKVGRYYYNKGDGKGGYSQHTKVGMYQPNAWGLYDMHGNVWEWCLDWWVANLGTAAVGDPKGAASGSTRIQRGDCYSSYAIGCRSACRGVNTPSGINFPVGFRACVLPSSVQ